MTRRRPKPPKAYKDLEFLNSPDARVVRMIAEFLEPQRRFRRANIKDTIVMFGSARIRPRKETLARLRNIEASIRRSARPTKQLLTSLRDAEIQVEMSRYYEDAVELSRLLTAWGKRYASPRRFVICSGGGPGIMEAANKGASLGGGESIGLNISLPFEQSANEFVSRGLDFEFHYFFMRKFWFVYLAKALVVFPGGFGTMDELMEVLTLLQTDKVKKRVAVVMYGEEYWKKVLDFDALVLHGMITREDLKLFRFMETPEEAFAYLKEFLTATYLKNGSNGA
ncbi:MAG TPA: LOG family protein [Bacteroidota bacterium]|nr:LOG family protein [Bacteroidota bacterium]